MCIRDSARGVLQWAGAVLAHLARTQGWQPAGRTLGVVGVGHVGSLVKEYAETWGFRVLCCDPPREAREHCGLDVYKRQARYYIMTNVRAAHGPERKNNNTP